MTDALELEAVPREYEVMATLLEHLHKELHPESDGRWLVSAQLLALCDDLPTFQVGERPLPDGLTEAFVAANQVPAVLRGPFPTPTPAVVVNPDELDEMAEQERIGLQDSASILTSRYPGNLGIVTLSRVGFHGDHALVWCYAPTRLGYFLVECGKGRVTELLEDGVLSAVEANLPGPSEMSQYLERAEALRGEGQQKQALDELCRWLMCFPNRATSGPVYELAAAIFAETSLKDQESGRLLLEQYEQLGKLYGGQAG